MEQELTLMLDILQEEIKDQHVTMPEPDDDIPF